jgi:hypothetical protein
VLSSLFCFVIFALAELYLDSLLLNKNVLCPFFNIKQIGVCFGANDLERASSTRPLVDIGSELVIIRPRLVREVKVLGSFSRSDRSIECRVVTKIIT